MIVPLKFKLYYKICNLVARHVRKAMEAAQQLQKAKTSKTHFRLPYLLTYQANAYQLYHYRVTHKMTQLEHHLSNTTYITLLLLIHSVNFAITFLTPWQWRRLERREASVFKLDIHVRWAGRLTLFSLKDINTKLH